MDIKRTMPSAGLMRLYCNSFGGDINASEMLELYKYSYGIFEDTPAGDPAFNHFYRQVTTYQKLCTYAELLENPDSKNISLCFSVTKPGLFEILDIYNIPHVPYIRVCVGPNVTRPQGVVVDIYHPSVSEDNRCEAMEFFEDFKEHASVLYRPLHFSE